MPTTIFYTTGTGNSLWVARELGQALGGATIRSMAPLPERIVDVDSALVGLVFPVHMWGVPGHVLQFLELLKKDSTKRYFAVAVNAGQVSRTLVQLRAEMRKVGLALSAGYDIVLPSNYIPWGGPPPSDRQRELFEAARAKLERVAAEISAKCEGSIEKGPLWQRIVFTALYKLTFKRIATMDQGFWVDEKCNGCGTCTKVCPTANVVMVNERPAWRHQCSQCLACIQWCPREALQLGKKTPAYKRYHHPEISVKDMLIRRTAAHDDARND